MLKTDSPFDIKLSSGREARPYGLVLDEGSGALTISAVAQDDSVYIRNVGKRSGDFDEQRSWKGGRGVEKLNDNAEGYWDGENIWTLTKNHLHNGLLWRFAKGLRKATSNFSNSKSWRALVGASLGISVSFTPDETGTYDKFYLWVRWRGSPNATNTLTAKLCENSAGDPGTALETVTASVSDVDGDSVSRLLEFDFDGTQSLSAGTTYHITVSGASASTDEGHWEVAVDADGSDSQVSSDLSAWNMPESPFSLLYRITDADVARTFKRFYLDNHMYVVDVKDDGTTASQIYINGDRGQATGGTTTTLVDTAFGCRSSAWADDVLAGAMIRFKKNGKWYTAQIASHTGDTYTFVSATAVAPAAGNEYYIYATEWWTELAGHGLGVVTGEPATLGSVVYFPQGGSVKFMAMATDFTAAGNHKWRADGGSDGYADLLLTHYDKVDGAIVWRVRNSTVGVSYAKKVAYGTNLTWNTAIPCGDPSFAITSINKQPGVLLVRKENGGGVVQGGMFIELQSGEEDTPDPENGAASLVVDKFFYYSWLHSAIRVFGSSYDDIGQDYRSFGLPDGREGNFADMDAYITLPVFAVDAGSGVSSVLVFDDIGWHEWLRGYAAGKRIRMVKAQSNPGARNRLWVDVGGELVYQELPFKKSAPRLDSGALYQHEGVVESSIIDMGTASDLPKFIKHLVVTVANLNTQGMVVELDYQVDEKCHTGEWVHATTLMESPESLGHLGLQNIKRFSYRLRMQTSNASVSPDIEGVVPNGYARTPLKLLWTLRIKSGGVFQIGSQASQSTSKLWQWLMENARLPYSVFMESKYLEADGYNVIVHPPRMFPYKPPRPGEPGEAVLTLVLEEA